MKDRPYLTDLPTDKAAQPDNFVLHTLEGNATAVELAHRSHHSHHSHASHSSHHSSHR